MKNIVLFRSIGAALALSLASSAGIAARVGVAPGADPSLALQSARVTLTGTSNLHDWSAATRMVRLTRIALAPPAAADPWAAILAPGGVLGVDVAVAARSLHSDRDRLDKNMYKALKADEHADIAFHLAKLDVGADGSGRAAGVMTIAGIERSVVFSVTTKRIASALEIKGTLDLLMTDYGIAPPKAMMGMLKTDPRVKVSFEIVLGLE